MKTNYKRVFLLCVALCLMIPIARAQALEDVVVYVRNGNSTAMTRYFDNTVNITILGKQFTYSKAQAEMVMKDFFNKNTIQDYVVMQTGSATDNRTKYAIGELKTSTGNFQLYILMKLMETHYLLQEIRIER